MRNVESIWKTAHVLIASLLGGIFALGVRYAESWLLDPQEDPQVHGAVIPGELSGEDVSLSPERISSEHGVARWELAVVTNRQRSPSASSLTAASGLLPGALGSVLLSAAVEPPQSHFEFARVSIPLSRRRGACSLDEADQHRVAVESFLEVPRDEFFRDIRTMLEGAESRDVLVFVHGFNVSLEAAAARAAQMAEDMPFHGVMIAFSWPSSQGNSRIVADDYLSDSMVSERLYWNLAELLAELNTSLPDDSRLHLLAHSMGNRVTLRALNALAGTMGPAGEDLILNRDSLRQRYPCWAAWSEETIDRSQLSTLVLAAPDVEKREFESLVSNILHTAADTVLYASDSDMALEGSLRLNQEGYRAGDSRAGIELRGLRIVEVSGVNRLDPLGHSYYGSNPAVLTQLSRLFQRADVDTSGSLATFARRYAVGVSR